MDAFIEFARQPVVQIVAFVLGLGGVALELGAIRRLRNRPPVDGKVTWDILVPLCGGSLLLSVAAAVFALAFSSA